MDSLSKQDLITTITKQADQIKRYESRLRDVVAAYKGLAKEKEALEISLKALNKIESPSEGGDKSDDSTAALVLSLSTLTAEKARMEEAFQADKKVTRDKYENQLASLREETRTLVQQHLLEISNLKAKIAYEIQEREKERAGHAAMLKELQMQLNNERKSKERLEDKVVTTSQAQASQAELEKRVRDLSSSLEAERRKLKRAEERTVETPALLVRLQQKLALVEQSHSIAIREEQIKAKRAEESARKICARQEERVALLEGKLAELSQTVGEYDLRRRRDQQLIQQLQDSLNGRLLDKITAGNNAPGMIPLQERVALFEGKLAELSQTVGEYDLRRRRDQQLIQQLQDSLNGRLLDKITAGNNAPGMIPLQERVALFEGKLAELSQTVGEYDLRRRRDQQLIQQLQDSLNGRLLDKITAGNNAPGMIPLQERVALFEGKLAELSQTVGEYDLRRRRDQQLIQQLQDSLNGRLLDKITAGNNAPGMIPLQERVALFEGKLAELSQTVGEYDLRRRRDQQLIQQLQDSLNGRLLDKITAGNNAPGMIPLQERVALLEGKLAELSQTVGEYDLRRRRDQQLIQQLQDSLNGRLLDKITAGNNAPEESQQKSETDTEKLADSEYLQTLIDKIHILKKELISENSKLGNPIDITTIFKFETYENIHTKCMESYEDLKQEFEAYKRQNVNPKDDRSDLLNEIDKLKSEVDTLKEIIETYKLVMAEEKQDKADALKLWEDKLKNEKDYHNEIVSDLKTRVQSLEKQVQTQRDRYAALLEETDNLIRARSERQRKVSAEESWKDGHLLADTSAPPHMLHYAHELARKDLDITQLRREKHIMEGQFRDCQREATIEKERFKEVVRTLKEEIDRLRRAQSREGANLEYLKNVVLAYLMSCDYAGRKHMLNAIAAVLHFTDKEREIVLKNI